MPGRVRHYESTVSVREREGRASRSSALNLWSGILGVDFTRPGAAVALGAIYLLSRLPWLTLGYGADPDAWRVAISARRLWEHGEYYPSRLPGYPLHELVTAALYPGGPLLTNLATLAVSFAGVLLFAAILKRLGAEPKGLLTLAFAFTPMVWIASSITLDYLWGLTFVLAAYLTLVRESPRSTVQRPPSERHRLTLDAGRWTLDSPLVAGVLLGVAIGFRPTSAVAALPFFVLIARERRPRPPIRFAATTGAAAFLLFLPVILRYGAHFLSFYDVRPTWGQVARSLGVEAFGLATLAGLALVMLLSWRRVIALPHRLRRDTHLAVAVLIVLLLAATFIRLPLEEAYLAPIIPFGLIGAARLLWRPAVIAACLLLVMGSLLDFHTRSTQGWSAPGPALVGIRPTKGRVLVDLELRRQRLRIVDGLRALELPEHSVVTAGFYYPILAERFKDELTLTLPEGFKPELVGPLTDLSEARDARDVVYVWLLTPADARRYRARGYRTYTLDWERLDALQASETYLPEQERFGVR